MKPYLAIVCFALLATSSCLGQGVTLTNWPNGHRSAVVIAFEVEQAQASDISRAADILKRHNMNGTFFVVPGYYESIPGVLKPLQGFEVATKGWNQSEWSLRYEDQRISIKRALTWLKGQGFDPVGFRAPFLKGDEETLAILSDLGFRYDSSRIGTLPSRHNNIIELPLSVAYDPFWNEEVERYLPLLYLAFEKTYEAEGLFLFYTYPEHGDRSLEIFLDYISGKDVWFASAREVVEWWEKREKVSLEIEDSTAIITNNGATPLSGVTLKTKQGYMTLPEIEPGETLKIDL